MRRFARFAVKPGLLGLLVCGACFSQALTQPAVSSRDQCGSQEPSLLVVADDTKALRAPRSARGHAILAQALSEAAATPQQEAVTGAAGATRSARRLFGPPLGAAGPVLSEPALPSSAPHAAEGGSADAPPSFSILDPDTHLDDPLSDTDAASPREPIVVNDNIIRFLPPTTHEAPATLSTPTAKDGPAADPAPALPLVANDTIEIDASANDETADGADSAETSESIPLQLPIRITDTHWPTGASRIPPLDDVAAAPVAEEPLPTESAPLPLVDRHADRRAMYAVNQQAGLHVRRGFTLAARSAYFAARSEFIQALRILSQALDAQQNDGRHARALAAGLKALGESDDFAPRGSRLEADLNLRDIISTHSTPVLQEAADEDLSPLVARQRYYTFAQEQLAEAAGQERVGSLALYGLARIHSRLQARSQVRFPNEKPKAMALHQAALMVASDNYMAANELGVLLAQYGELPLAGRLLQHSLSVIEQPATWHNLAVVHQRMGQTELAQQAQHQAALLAKDQQASAAAGSDGVQWIDAEKFRAQAVSEAPPVARNSRPEEKVK